MQQCAIEDRKGHNEMDRLIEPHGSMRAKIAALKTGESFSRA